MKKGLIFLLSLTSLISLAQIGIGTTSPEGILDVVSTNSGLIIPRVANTGAVTTPVNGMLIYDLSSNCTKAYENDAWSGCLSAAGGGASTPSVVNDCNKNGFVGAFINDEPLNGASFTVTISNNGFSTTELTMETSDLVLSGISGISVDAVSPTTVSLTAGQSQVVTYNLTGTPATIGVLTGNWTKLSLSCSKTKGVTNGGAIFTNASNNQYVFSVDDTGLPLNNQGVLISGTTINVPYTSGLGSYASYTSPEEPIDAAFCEDGDSDWTFSYSFTGANFDPSGNIVVTLTTKKNGVETDWIAKRVPSITTINFNCVSLPLNINGFDESNTIGIDEGGDAIRGALSTNGAAYDLATVNTPVEITLAEYNNLLVIVPGAEVKGFSGVLPATAGALGTPGGVTGQNGATYDVLPDNSYVAGVARTNYAGSTAFSITVSDGQGNTNVVCLTDPGPAVTYAVLGVFKYFAIKRPTTNSGTGKTSLGDFKTINSIRSTYIPGNSGGTPTRYGGVTCGGNGYTTSWSSSGSPSLQVISSTQKSW